MRLLQAARTHSSDKPSYNISGVQATMSAFPDPFKSSSKDGLERASSVELEDALCYGDDICLYCEEYNGYLYNHQTGSIQNSLNVFNNQPNRHHPNDVLDPYSIRFTIVPKQNYKEAKKARKNRDPTDVGAAKTEEDRNRQDRNRQRGKKLHYDDIFQLQHKFTGKYIHVSTTETSRRVKNNMMVFLSEENGKRAQFRILPKFKVKAEGDVVQVNDEVVFESIKTPGQYLHVSSSYQVSRLLTGCELNLGVSSTGFTTLRARPANSTEHGVLRAGSLLRLLHKETNSYLVASGIANREPTENVHMRMRKPEAWPSSSAITYWVVEDGTCITLGDVIYWKQHIRLRHMTTLRYLMVQANGKLSLTSDGSDPLTVFRFHPVIELRKEVEVENYTWIQHVISERWIHADNIVYLRRELGEIGVTRKSKREKLRWDTAPLKQVSSDSDRNYDDAFTIQHVSDKLESLYRFAIGMVPGIQDMVLSCKAGVTLTISDLKATERALEELSDWMYDKGSVSKQRQKLLRDLGIVDLLVELLMQQDIQAQNMELLSRVQINAYKALETFLKGDCRKNELYVCKYLEFFTSMFSVKSELGRRATEMMTELIKDNRMVIDRLTKAEIKAFIELIKREQNYRFLSLLGELCVCDGVALPENQNFIADNWLAADNRGVLLTEVGSNIDEEHEATVVYVSEGKGRPWIPMHEYCGEEDDDGTCSSPQYLFLKQQLDLFGKLCVGRNHHCIKMITEDLHYLTWEEAFMCLKDETLPDELRAKYCDLITGMFVDVGDNRSILDQLNLTFIYADIGQKDILGKIAEKMPVANKKNFPMIRDWLNRFFDSNQNMVASLMGRNKLIEQVLRLVHNLITYGYYSGTRDIKSLLGPLLLLLDGTNDRPDAVNQDEVRGGLFGLAGAYADVNEYRERDRFKKSPQAKEVVAAKYKAMEVVDLIMDIEYKIRLEKFLALYHRRDDSERKLLEKLNTMMTETTFFKESDTGILLDLTRYDYSKMVVKAMSLMNKHYSAHENLFKGAVQAQVLIRDDSQILHQHLLGSLPHLRRLLSVRIRPNQVEQVCELLTRLKSWCHLPDEPDEPHPINQNILVNNGVLEIIFNLLRQKLDPELVKEYDGFRKVLKHTLVLLKFLTRGNKDVQTRAFDNFGFLVDIRGVEKELGEALVEIFTNNQENCLHVKPEQIKTVMQRTAYLKENASEFLDLLCAIVKVEEIDQPLKRNQFHVMRALMKNYHDVAYILEKPQEHRQEILRSGRHRANELSYLISLIDLLASSAEGVNAYIESQCQSILRADEVIETLNDDQIDNNLKRPYLRFLLWVYVKAGISPMDSGTLDLSEKILPWKRGFLRHLSKCTQWVVKNQERTKKLLKKAPPKSSVSESEDDQMFATLHFIFDAALPFLREEYQAERIQNHSSREQREMIEHLTIALMKFTDAVVPLISSKTQMSNMNSAVMALLSMADGNKQREAKEDFVLRLDAFADGELQMVLSEAREKYIDDYEQEKVLNDHVNSFAQKMANLYKGRNRYWEQLQLQSRRSETQVTNGSPDAADSAYCDVTEAKKLPLGQEFQKMVNRFINRGGQGKKYCHVQVLIHQLHISCTKLKAKDQGSAEQVALDIKCLQVMRALIHNQQKQIPSNADPRAAEHLRASREIRMIQEELNEYRAIVQTMSLMNRTQRGLTGQYLAFLTTMFYDANEDSQKAISDYFLGTRDELFFHTCRNLFQSSVTSSKELRSLFDKDGSKWQDTQNTLGTLKAKFSTGRHANINTIKKGIEREGKKIKREQYMNGTIPSGQAPSKVASTGKPSIKETPRPQQDEFNIQLLLELLAAMCDGQKKDLQDYLRDQPDNIKSINLVGEVVKYFHYLHARIDDSNIGLLIQLLTTLNEFCSGNSENTHTVFDHDLCDYLNYVLRQDLKLSKPEHKLKLYEIIGILIMSMVEEDHPSTTRLTLEVRNALDVERLMRIANHYYHRALMVTPKDATYMASSQVKVAPRWARDKMLEVGFKYHFIVQRMLDIQPDVHIEDIDEGSEEEKYDAARKYYEENSLSVEVVTPKGLQKIRFRVKDKRALREETKETVKWSIQRGSASDKLRDLLDWSKDILEDIEYQRGIRKRKALKFLIEKWTWWNYVVIGLSLAFNIFMLATWEAPGALGKTPIDQVNRKLPESITSPVPKTFPWYNYVLWPVGIIHNIFSLIVVVVYFLSNNPVPPSCPKWRKGDPKEEEGKDTERQSHLRPKLISVISVYYVAFLVFSICGTIFYGYFFAFHLLNIVFNSNLLQRVIKAVTQNGPSLLLVGLLGLFILYIFTLVAFALMRRSLDPNGEQTLYCFSLWQCLVTILRFGLLGELFEFMRPHEFDMSFANFGWAAIYHIAFFIIITTIGLNIVFGIILESFSELRESKNEAEKDMKSTCFICSRSSFEFEKQAQKADATRRSKTGIGFRHHVQKEHNMWAYIFLRINLNAIDEKDFTTIEKHVFEQMAQQKITFFPIGQALSLTNTEDDGVQDQLADILRKLNRIVAKQEAQEQEKQRQEEAARQEKWKIQHSEDASRRDEPEEPETLVPFRGQLLPGVAFDDDDDE